MDATVFQHSDIKLGKEVSLIALCSHVDRKLNLSTTGSYREIYRLNGKNGALIDAVLFKNNFTATVNPEDWKEVPILVNGMIGEHQGVLNIVITAITNLKDTVDVNDLMGELMDTTVWSELNEFLYEQGISKILSQDFLKPANGIEDGAVGILVQRLYKVLRASEVLFPEILKEYVKHLHTLVHIYRYTENRLDERVTEDTLKHRFLRAMTMNPQEYPEYLDFVKMHHLIMKPRGCDIEILDRSFNTTSRSRSDTE